MKMNLCVDVSVNSCAFRAEMPECARSLIKLLSREAGGGRVLIFCETKRGCDDVRMVVLLVDNA
jgi:hypothetical protein